MTALCSGINQIVYATQTIGDVGDHYYVSDVFAELSGNKYLHYSLPGYDIHVQDIINTGDGYLLLAEHSWPVGDFPYGEYYVTSDAVIIRLDDSLKFIWSRTCAGSGRESFSSGVELDDCSFLVAGFSNSNDGDFGNKKKAIEPFILKISGLGKILSQIVLPVFGTEPVDADGLRRFPLEEVRGSQLECPSQHPLGSCRMGMTREHSVVDTFGKVWDTRGLYVADGSLVPTSLGVNPQLTIMTLATRVAWHLRDTPYA